MHLTIVKYNGSYSSINKTGALEEYDYQCYKYRQEKRPKQLMGLAFLESICIGYPFELINW